VRLTLLNPKGEALWPPPAIERDLAATGEIRSPGWFQRLIAPPPQVVTIPISLGLMSYGALAIATEPLDEISEAWADFRDLAVLLAGSPVLSLVVVCMLLGRALRPIAEISRALEGLEHGRYGLRLPAVSVPELQQIAARYNALAGRLEAATLEKDRLGQRIVTLQDDERRAIALELHDEFGPCLFGIRVDAHYIDATAEKAGAKAEALLKARARDVIQITDQMQQHIRSMLRRLYPTTLGEVGLDHLLGDLIDGFRTRHPEIDWTLELPTHPPSFGDTVDLTLYRTVQESLTNAARHGAPTAVRVKLACDGGRSGRGAARTIRLTIEDDGDGLPADLSEGLGLTSMSHRVRILSGQFEIRNRPGGGAVVEATLPVAAPAAAARPGRRALSA
jgi:two-component system sensor histidine kinase UhpB